MNNSILDAKKQIVAEFKEKFAKSKSVIFIKYTGITVAQDTKLRCDFRAQNVEYKIYKNRLIKIALDELGIKGYDDACLEGATSVAFSPDETTAANILFKNIKDVKVMEAKFGVLNGEVINASEVEALSKIPSKPVLIAMLMGMLNAPVAALARALNEISKKEA